MSAANSLREWFTFGNEAVSLQEDGKHEKDRTNRPGGVAETLADRAEGGEATYRSREEISEEACSG